MLLKRDHFLRAAAYMNTKARPLEQALFQYEFESGSVERVVGELMHYQNDDGGFGHGLEPDLRCDTSSALATTHALHLVQTVDLNHSGKEMVRRAIDYLVRSYQDDIPGWDIIPPEADRSPRASWWEYGAFQDHWGNANADILAFLLQYRDRVPTEMLDSLIAYAVDHLAESDLSEMHELQCYIHLADHLDAKVMSRIKDRLDQFVAQCIPTHPANRDEYGATPLTIIDSPSSRYYPQYAEVIPSELDEMIRSQTDDGSWAPNWHWGRYDDVWEIAREEWKGILTLNHLKILRQFDRIEQTQ